MLIVYDDNDKIAHPFFREFAKVEKVYLKEIQAVAPRIGIFWLEKKNNKIKTVFEEFKSIQKSSIVGDVVCPSIDHNKKWKDLIANKKVPVNSKFTDLPRGRINFNRKNRKFIIIFGKYLVNNFEAKLVIRQTFYLDSGNTEYEIDEHYNKFKSWTL